MRSFDLHEPTTIQEAIDLLQLYDSFALPIAGGTDLLLDIQRGARAPDHLISLTSIPDLDFISSDDHLHIGAASSLTSIVNSKTIQQSCAMLTQAAGMIGALQTRNLATIGGNICNAVPSADTAPPLLAARAEAIISSPNGNRCVPLEEFFIGPRKTVLGKDELLQEIRIPIAPVRTGTAYNRFTERKAMDLAIAGVAVCVTVDEDGRIIQAGIALGAVAPTPIRVYAAEEILINEMINPHLIEEAANKVVQASKPISDLRASADYRKHLLKILLKHSLRKAYQNAMTEVLTPL
jgi:CO/xanthine dehydrogenase FAD-binding subunit